LDIWTVYDGIIFVCKTIQKEYIINKRLSLDGKIMLKCSQRIGISKNENGNILVTKTSNTQIPFSEKEVTFFMKKALYYARLAFKKGEVPVGAIVVSPEGKIIGRGSNCVMKIHSQSGHAEVIAIQKAGKTSGDWRLLGCWVFVTLEPCHMCMSLIQLSRCAGVVYGADSPLFGFHLDKEGAFQLYNENVVKVIAGPCAEESVSLLKKFFKGRRESVVRST